MSEISFRTEDIKLENILNLFVENALDREVVNLFKSPAPTLIEGSRGTGKSFLMTVAVAELQAEFDTIKILPVYVGFNGSSLVYSKDPLQFRHWMLAKLIRQLLKELHKKGLTVSRYASSLLGNADNLNFGEHERQLEELVAQYETSYKSPGQVINASSLPDVSEVKDAIEDICEAFHLQRVCLFFDEAAHVFRPEQQRQFFTLFRDLRSPYISCNAAVYPGVTHYGEAFEISHDATFRRIERDILEADYVNTMRQMAFSQLDDRDIKSFEQQDSHFKTLAYSAGGNPRILLKTIARLSRVNTNEIESTIKGFYRSDIWAEHTSLGEKYQGHKSIVDWGRTFIEKTVIPSIVAKNSHRLDENRETSIYFWIHKDAPELVEEAMRLLEYTGIIRKIDDGIRATRAEIGTRYEVKYGCIVSLHATPLQFSPQLQSHLSVKRFTEFGANHREYKSLLSHDFSEDQDEQSVIAVNNLIAQPIDVLDLTAWQKTKLKEAGITDIKSILEMNEDHLISSIAQVGPVRARRMKNAAMAELLEYLSG